ncbi:type II toxin-antitoxin system VapC family toxin [Sulfolobus acidocaldarius]|uniref:PIN domain-containing protein n=3 Tax=Sulfolobus acidocaldarius TaxID=2285 RepID=A0A0U3GI76_9CREN|nr:type II toxin-antitoxin system VapC family toxin [Sulfolobus acidocaldarius]AGE71973.1 hypothetical protein SacN8_10115 [Sulfolobus acidocaldarius N8]AGE74289.1 hypothetical protein SacRon12I_10365 [Sulfolobus acidocaldarius Ron12/I]ALU29829.1 hypothetical protein ATY89_07680 [Sulfolobus acidocaldarius]ALU32568.1 hypothetical protein ATZ20_10700 [Sulfolobus acidocaldarius]WCM35876.1 PIN domain-containing protein [Sulfolobus acidocaldarius DSM 639]
MRLKYLFDSSAIFEALKSLGSKAIDVLREESTINLAYYELGNVLWKYRNEINVKTVLDALTGLLSLMNVIDVKLDYQILKESVDKGITYYDAAYLVTSLRMNLTLVSLDRDLIKYGAIRLKEIL